MTLTCRFKGEAGNDIDVRCNYYSGETLPEGIKVNITAMQSGSVNPAMSEAITGFGAEWWHYVINPFTDTESLNLLRTELVNRWGPLKQIDGICFMAKRGTHGTVTTFAEQRNDYLFSMMPTSNSPEPAYIWAAAYVRWSLALYLLILLACTNISDGFITACNVRPLGFT
ncbi:hypothetical protein A6J56_011600 [Pasteurella multocida]|nr:hypothetical protein A6J56_011600 [Pasteurella multocida]